jgi:hypothetical protein
MTSGLAEDLLDDLGRRQARMTMAQPGAAGIACHALDTTRTDLDGRHAASKAKSRIGGRHRIALSTDWESTITGGPKNEEGAARQEPGRCSVSFGEVGLFQHGEFGLGSLDHAQGRSADLFVGAGIDRANGNSSRSAPTSAAPTS